MSDPFQRLYEASQDKLDPFQRLAQANDRNNNKIVNMVDNSTAYNPLAGTTDPVIVPKSKSLGDYLGDTAVDIAKLGITAEQAVVGAMDLGIYAAGTAGEGYQRLANAIAPNTFGEPEHTQFGVAAKQLKDGLDYDFNEAKKYWEDNYYSDIRKKQQEELHTGNSEEDIAEFNKGWENAYAVEAAKLNQTNPIDKVREDFATRFDAAHNQAYQEFMSRGKMGWDKSLGENAEALGDKFAYIGDNPSLGVGAAIESTGYLVPSRAISKAIMSLEAAAARAGGNAAEAVLGKSAMNFGMGSSVNTAITAATQAAPKISPYLAAGIGEGTITAATIADAGRANSPNGLTSDAEMAAALGAGTLTGLIGGGISKVGGRYGIDDIDSFNLARNQLTGAATKLPKILDNAPSKAILSAGSEAVQEGLQGLGETILPNIAQGKDPLDGLETDIALGAVAGGIMGGGVAAPQLLSATAGSVNTLAKDKLQALKDKASKIPLDELSDASHPNYNPAAAYEALLPQTVSPDTTVQERAKGNIEVLVNNVNSGVAKRTQELAEITELIDVNTSALESYQAARDNGTFTPEMEAKEIQVKKTLSDMAKAKVGTEADLAKFTEQYLALNKAMENNDNHTRAVEGTGVSPEDIKANVDNILNPTVSSATEEQANLAEDGEVNISASNISEEAPVSEVAKASAEHIKKYPSSYDPEQLLAIANSNTPLFTPAQKDSLRLLADFRVAENKLKDIDVVEQDILKGFKGNSTVESYLGVNDYSQMVYRGVRNNNTQLTENTLNSLAKFESSHTKKAAALREAYTSLDNPQSRDKGGFDALPRDKRAVQVQRLEDGTWTLNYDADTFMSLEELKKVGGVEVSWKTTKLVKQVETEASILSQALNTLESYAENFSKTKPSTEVTLNDVQSTSGISESLPEAPAQTGVTSQSVGTAPDTANETIETEAASSSSTIENTAPVQNLTPASELDLVFDESGIGRGVPKQESQNEPVIPAGSTESQVTVPETVGEGAVLPTESQTTGTVPEQELESATEANTEELETSQRNSQVPAQAVEGNDGTVNTVDRPVVIMPIGTSGSGKSTWIKSLPKDQYINISPDEMRVEFTGDMNDKSKDAEIYEEVNNRTIAAMQEGKSVIIDTTNLQRDRRRNFIKAVRDVIPDAEIQYKLLPLNSELAKQRIKNDIAKGVNRANVPDSTIDRHALLYSEMLKDIKEENITPYPEALVFEQSEDARIPALRNITKGQRTTERLKEVVDKENPRNLVKAHFNQDSKGNNPLTKIKDFLSQLKGKSKEVLNQFLKQPVTTVQANQLKHFMAFNEEFKKLLPDIFISKKVGYEFQDLTNFIGSRDESGNVVFDENTTTALSLAAYSWVIANGSKTNRSNSDIARMFGLESDTVIPRQVGERYREAADTKLRMIQKLGKSATTFLGLKVIKDSDAKYQQRLENSMGALVMYLMEDAGYIEIAELDTATVVNDLALMKGTERNLYKNLKETVDKSRAGSLTRNDIDINGEGRSLVKFGVVRSKMITVDGELVVDPKVAEVIEKAKGTGSFMSRLFGNDVGLRRPLLKEPKGFVQKAIRKTLSLVPGLQARNLDKIQAHGFTVRGNVTNTLASLNKHSQEFLHSVLGLDNSPEALSKIHISERDAEEARISNEIRALEQGIEFTDEIANEDGTYAEFWDTQYISANQRMYYNSNLFNVQSTQMHRAMAGLTAFEVTFDAEMDSMDNKGRLTMYGQFLRAVAEGIEDIGKTQVFKTGLPNYNSRTVDKVPGAVFVPIMEQYLEQGYVQNAIQSMMKVMDNPTVAVSAEDQANITAFVQEGGMGIQSLHSLIELASYASAVLNGTPFTTSISIGSDGVTNGVAIANTLTGTLSGISALQFGIFNKQVVNDEANPVKNYMDSKTQGIKDYYEDLGSVLQSFWETAAAKYKPETVEALAYLVGTLNDRKLTKAWAIPFNYNAGFSRLKEALAETALAGIYSRMADIANEAKAAIEAKDKIGYETAVEKGKALSTHLKALVGNSVRLGRVENLSEFEFEYADLIRLNDRIMDTYGEAAQAATEEYAKDYINARDINIALHRTGFEIYALLKKKVIEKVVKDLIAQGKMKKIKLKKSSPEILYDGLSIEDQAKVDKALLPYSPVINSALSKLSENSLEGGLFLANPSYSENVENDGLDFRHNYANREGTRNFRMEIQTPTTEAAGVKGWAMQVQSVDAAVSNISMAESPSINGHDNNSSGLSTSTETAVSQNKAFFESTAYYRSQVESVQMVIRTLTGLRDLSQEYGITGTEIKQLMTEVLGDVRGKKAKEKGLRGAILDKNKLLDASVIGNANLPVILDKLLQIAYTAEANKVKFYQDVSVIHQYAGEGGEYTLTEEDYAKLDAELLSLREDWLRNSKSLIQLTKSINKAVTGDFKWGKNITDSIVNEFKSLTPLQKWLEQRKGEKVIATDLIKVLDVNAAQKAILNMITPLLSEGLTVQYFDLDNAPKDMNTDGIDIEKVHGWYDPNANTIYIKSVDSLNSKVDLALVVHELLHGAIAKRLWALQAEPTKFPEATKHFDRLDELRKQILAAYPNDETLQGMLINVDEFISYGLTEPKIQNLMKGVLVGTNGRSKSGIKSLFKAFIESVAGMLNLRVNQINAFEAFIVDTAGLVQSLDIIEPANININIKFKAEGKDLNSSYVQMPKYPSQHGFNPGQSAASKTALEIMEGLPTNVSAEFNKHLDNLIGTVIGNLYKNDISTEAKIEQVQNVVSSAAIAAGFNLSMKEDQVAQSVEIVMNTYLESHAGSLVATQVRNLFNAAQAKLKPEDFHQGDWATATQAEEDLAESKYDYLFRLTPANRKGYLGRFMAIALASEDFKPLLDFVPVSPAASKKTWFEKAVAFYNYAVNWLTNKLAGVSSTQSINEKLKTLTNRLTEIDMKSRQNTVHILDKAWNLTGKPFQYLNTLGGKGASKLFNRDLFKNSRFSLLRAAGMAARASATSQGDQIPGLIQELRNQMNPHERLGAVAEVLNEVIAPNAIKKVLEALIRATSANAAERQSRVDNTRKVVLSGFDKNGKDLTKEDHKAVTYGVLRTDLQALLEEYSTDDIVNMISNPKVLANEIKGMEVAIAKSPNGNDILTRSQMLAWYMVDGTGGDGLVQNALSVVSGIETAYEDLSYTVDHPKVKEIDRLVSLYALANVNSSHLSKVQDLLKVNPKAVMDLVRLHESLAKTAKTEFADNALSYTKGYMPEITSPYKEIGFAKTPAERELMIKQGWKYVSTLAKDPMDGTGIKYLMSHSDMGYERFVSGAVDLANTKSKGTEVYNRRDPRMIAISKQRLRTAAIRAKQSYKDFDPKKQKPGLIATYANDGTVLSYGYQMAHAHRDAYLERNNNFGDLLGAFAGSNYYKPVNKTQHTKVLTGIYEDYRDNYKKSPKAYTALSPDSTDPVIAEMWRMLPHDFKVEATKKYGKGNPIIIRNDIFNMTFGFKKYGLAQAFDKLPADRNAFERKYIKFAQLINKDMAQAWTAKSGRVSQEIVKWAKDVIVIRGIKVMIGNIVSNGLMLLASDISPLQIIRDTADALYNARKYQKSRNNLLQTEARIRIEGNTPKLLSDLAKAQDELISNPLAKYIEAGLLSTIVEDVMVQQSDYSYKSQGKERLDKWLTMIPSPIRTLGAYSVAAPGTEIYQFLASVTQLADFIAKYSLAKKLQSGGTSFEEAVSEGSRTFINYDVPTSKALQYGNDMGLFMFTKFFLRFQAVLMKIMDKKAATVVAQHLAVEHITGMAGILDPLMLNRIGSNPFEMGAFTAISATGELPIVNVFN